MPGGNGHVIVTLQVQHHAWHQRIARHLLKRLIRCSWNIQNQCSEQLAPKTMNLSLEYIKSNQNCNAKTIQDMMHVPMMNGKVMNPPLRLLDEFWRIPFSIIFSEAINPLPLICVKSNVRVIVSCRRRKKEQIHIIVF